MDQPKKLTLDGWLDLLSSFAKIVEAQRGLTASYEAEYLAVARSGNKPPTDAALQIYMAVQFDYLAEKFSGLWPESAQLEEVVRQKRPDIPLFSPTDFERLTQSILYLLEGRFFEPTRASYDGGIDLLLKEPLYVGAPLGEPTGYATTVVQCKLYRGQLPVSFIREFFGVLTNEVAEGYLVTTGSLTTSGLEFIRSANRSPFANKFVFVGPTKLKDLMDLCRELTECLRELETSYTEHESDDLSPDERRICDDVDAIRAKGWSTIHAPLPGDAQLNLL